MKCPDCLGKGGLEYEPGLVIHECNRCHGVGIIAGSKKDMKILTIQEVSPNVYRVVTESEKYGVVSQTVLMMPETCLKVPNKVNP